MMEGRTPKDKSIKSHPVSISDIEINALMQKLKDIAELEDIHSLFEDLEVCATEADVVIKLTTAIPELEHRLSEVQKTLGMERGVKVERESVINALRYTSNEYEAEVSPRLKKIFDDLKSCYEYPDDLPQREKVEATVNEIIDHFYQQSVKSAVNTYRQSMVEFIADYLNEEVD